VQKANRNSMSQSQRVLLIYTAVVVVVMSICAFVSLVFGMANEYVIKARFVVNFAKFAEWPDGTFTDDSYFQLCVVGDQAIESAFLGIAGKQIKSNTCKVLFTKNNLKDLQQCQLIFLDRSVETEKIKQILDFIDGKPVLTIGERKRFIQHGGVINFFIKDDRIYFEISLDNARQQGIKLSSQLLQLAVLVENK
jgi:hypothetical protein